MRKLSREDLRKMIAEHGRREDQRKLDQEFEQLMKAPTYVVQIVHKGNTFPVEVKSWFSINVLKAKIRDNQGIPMNTFNLVSLIHGGKPLDGLKDLEELFINQNSVLHLIEIKTTWHTKVNSMVTSCFTIVVEANDTIDNVKLKIHEHTGLLPEQQMLRDQPVEGKRLEDGKTLLDYNIYNEGIIFLRTVQPFDIFGQSSSSSSGAGL